MRTKASDRIGFMQGRLSPMVDGRIQAFPWPYWREEFSMAAKLGFCLMEWTLDQARLHENPVITSAGQAEIRALCQQYGITVPSLTGDCFMQAPFWKAEKSERRELERDFSAVVQACTEVGISVLVVPLVDSGRLDNVEQETILVDFMSDHAAFLSDHCVRVAFESDYSPGDLARFITRLDPTVFGINYDIGNSAALGFDPVEEIDAYGTRIVSVHVKDRLVGGTTVPLGLGSADFEAVFSSLNGIGYAGNYILQSARAADGDHAGALCRYRDMTAEWLSCHGS